MGLLTFSKAGLTTWAPTRGRNRPAVPQIVSKDVSELTEAMTYRVSNYGVDLVHSFVFKDLPVEEYDGGWDWPAKAQDAGTMSLVGWFFAVGRMRDSFTFTDEDSVAHTVRFKSADFKPSDPDSKYVDVSFDLIEENYL